MNDTAIRETLIDLKHDLAKYICLPIAWLPDDASEDQVCDALRQALLQTRRAQGGIQTAREIWTLYTL